ncbi:MAG: Fur family transcriptional regulator [Pseudomonadota bacterium]
MTNADIRQRLLEHGIQPTTQRIDVATVLLAKPQHLSAEQIQEALRATGRRVSKATVYNTLRLYCEKGLIREVIVDPTRVFYDSTIEPHHHFFNVDTGELSDIEPDAVRFLRLAEAPAGTERAGVEVLIRVRQTRV